MAALLAYRLQRYNGIADISGSRYSEALKPQRKDDNNY